MSSFSVLQQQSSPITQYGYPIQPPPSVHEVPYDGTLLPGFIKRNGGDHKSVRQFLRQNRIGSVFDLEDGESVIIVGTGISDPINASYSRNFSLHSQA